MDKELPFLLLLTLSPSSGLKMKAVCSSEMLVSIHRSARHYNTEHQHGYEKPKQNSNTDISKHVPSRFPLPLCHDNTSLGCLEELS
jgi:hypothetical protein